MTRLRTLAEHHPNGVVAALFAYLLIVGIAVFYIVLSERTVSDQNHRALCAFRGDLDRRVADTRAFLADHPHGIPGITAANLELSIRNQEATIASLRFVQCGND